MPLIVAIPQSCGVVLVVLSCYTGKELFSLLNSQYFDFKLDTPSDRYYLSQICPDTDVSMCKKCLHTCNISTSIMERRE